MKTQLQLLVGLVVLLIAKMPLAHTAPANTVVTTINVGNTPAGIAATNKLIYVANQNSNTVDVIDATSQSVIATISDPSFNQPYSITINPAGTLAYITNSNDVTVSVVDLATNTVTRTITGFDGPTAMGIIPNGKWGYVCNYGAGLASGNVNTVNVVDLQSNTIAGPPIIVGLAPAALAITPDGNFVYVANYVYGTPNTGTVSVIDTRTNLVVDTIDGFFGPYAIVITPNGQFAYVTNFGSNNFIPFGNTVSVISLQNNTIVDTITVGSQPSGIAVAPDGQLIYISNFNDPNYVTSPGTINIVQASNNAVLAPLIQVGDAPGTIAITPNGEWAYVSNYNSNTVSVIALAGFELTLTGSAKQNVFLLQKDLINQLNWKVAGTTSPVSYTIYRDSALTDMAGVIPSSQPLQFLDHNRKKGVTYNYYLVGTNPSGTVSTPVSISITQPR